jgi:hypothetical protein
VEDEPTPGIDGEVDVEGKVLGELEGLESVDDDGLCGPVLDQQLTVEEQAVTAGTGDVAKDGRVGDAEETGDLTETGSFGGKSGDVAEETPLFEPVVGGEGSR